MKSDTWAVVITDYWPIVVSRPGNSGFEWEIANGGRALENPTKFSLSHVLSTWSVVTVWVSEKKVIF